MAAAHLDETYQFILSTFVRRLLEVSHNSLHWDLRPD
jgi:hypothetical protein